MEKKCINSGHKIQPISKIINLFRHTSQVKLQTELKGFQKYVKQDVLKKKLVA